MDEAKCSSVPSIPWRSRAGPDDEPALERVPSWVVSAEGGAWPRWSRDGSELFYIDSDTNPIAARLQIEAGHVSVVGREQLFAVSFNAQDSTTTSMRAGTFLLKTRVSGTGDGLILVTGLPKPWPLERGA